MKFRIDKRRMLPHQVAFWELPNFVKLLVGGYGCGKTHIGALRSIYDSFVNAPAPHLYVSPSYKQARKTMLISIKELLDGAVGVCYGEVVSDEGAGEGVWQETRLLHYYLPGFAANFETGMQGSKVLHCVEIQAGEK